MGKIISIFKDRLQYLTYFYRYLRGKLVFITMFSIAIGILDGFGLSMFMPLLQFVDGKNNVANADAGAMSFLFDFIDTIGIKLTLKSVLAFLCVFFILKGAFQFLGNAYIINVQQFFVKKIRIKMLESLSAILYKKFVVSDIGRIQNSMTGEVARLSNALRAYLAMLQGIVLVLVYVGFAIAIDFQFSLIVAIGGWLTNFVFRKIYIVTKKGSTEVTQESHQYQGLVIQFVSSFKYLKATGSLPKLKRKLKKQIEKIEGINRHIGIMGSIAVAMREPTMIIVVSLAILVKITFLGATLGTILLSLIFFYRALASLVGVQTQYNAFLTYSGSITNMDSFQRELDKSREPVGSYKLSTFKDKVVLKNVVVQYGEKRILDGIDLQINKNKSIAIVGESGSGKTTLVNVIAGLLPTDNGQIIIDDILYNELNIFSYQERIGYITQEPIIFNASIFDNITLWDEDNPSNREKFKEAVRRATLEDFINNLPNKERTQLGNNGINISGGQKQRISIARELYKNIDILIMDEATSALDSETERMIQKSIDNLKGSITLLIVAHRLSTVKNTDTIILMKGGKIDACGTYSELLVKSTTFQKMVDLQELSAIN